MKKIALLLSIIASVLVLTSCANQRPSEQQPTVHSESAQTEAVEVRKHQRKHYDYKGESLDK